MPKAIPLLEQYRKALTWSNTYPGSFTKDPRELAQAYLQSDPSAGVEGLAGVNDINNTLIRTGNTFDELRNSTVEALKGSIGGNLIGDSIAQGAGALVGNLPQLGLQYALTRQVGLPAIVPAAGIFGYTAQDSFNRTADSTSSVISGASNLLGTIAGQGVGNAIVDNYGLSGAPAFVARAGSQFATDQISNLLDLYEKPTLTPSPEGDAYAAVNLSQDKGFGEGSRFRENAKVYEDPALLGGHLLASGVGSAFAALGSHGKEASIEQKAEVRKTNNNFYENNTLGSKWYPLDASPQGGGSFRMPTKDGVPILRSITGNHYGDDYVDQVVVDGMMRHPKILTNLPNEVSSLKEASGVKTTIEPPGVDETAFTILRHEKLPSNLKEEMLTSKGKISYVVPYEEKVANNLAASGLDVAVLGDKKMLVSNYVTPVKPSLDSHIKVMGGRAQLELDSTLRSQARYIDQVHSFSSLKTYLLGQGDKNSTTFSQLRFLKDSGADLRSLVVEYSGDPRVAGFYDPRTQISGINRKAATSAAFQKLAHETMHDVYGRVSRVKPALVNAVDSFVEAIGKNGRKAILEELHDLSGLPVNSKALDVSYGSDAVGTLRRLGLEGSGIEAKKVNSMEFSGKVMELLSAIAEKSPSKLPSFIEKLPTPITSLLFDAHSALRGMFNPNKPTLSSYLPKDAGEGLQSAVRVLGKAIYNQESVNQTFMQRMGDITSLQEGRPLLRNLGDFVFERDAPSLVVDTHRTLLSITDEDPAQVRKLAPGMNDTLAKFGTQQLVSHVYPVTQTTFDKLTRYSPAKTENIRNAFSYLSNKVNLNSDQRNADVERMFREMRTKPQQLELLGSLWKQNNKRESEGVALITPEQAKSKGLGPTAVTLFERFPKVLDYTLAVKIDQFRQAKSNDMAKFLWTSRPDLTKEQVTETARAFLNGQTKVCPAFKEALGKSGIKLTDVDASMNLLWKLPEFADIKKHFQSFGYGTENDTLTPTQARFLNAFYTIDSNTYTSVGKMYSYLAKEGYMSMVRTGRYRVKARNEEGYTAVYRDFESEKEASKYAAELKKKYTDVDAYDTDSPERFGASFRSKELTEASRKAKEELIEVINSIAADKSLDPAATQRVTEVLEEVKRGFRPFEDEMIEAIKNRPEKFFKSRQLVEGFKNENFIPSAITYIETLLSDSQRNVSRSAVELDLADPTYDSGVVPSNLRDYMKERTRYVLDGKQWEASGIRKFMYFHTLVGSIANATQNLTQPIFTMLPRLIQETGGDVIKSVSIYTKALKEVLQYNNKGKSGTKYVSDMLRTAETTGVYNPRSIDVLLENKQGSYFDPSNQKGLSYLKNFTDGVSDKVGWIARETERFNRQVGFAAGVIAAVEHAGIKDKNRVYSAGRILTDDTNFVGSKANRPLIFSELGKMHGPVLMAMTLRMFSYNVLNQLTSMALTAYNPKIGRSSITGKAFEDRAGSIMSLAYTASALGLAAGLQGLPFATDINNTLIAFWGKDKIKEMQKLARDYFSTLMDAKNASVMSEAIFTGVPQSLGIQTSNRLGYGNLLGLRATKPDSLSAFGGAIAGGAVANVVDKIGDAVGTSFSNFASLTDEDTLGAKAGALTSGLAAMSPTVVRQALNFGDQVFAGVAKNVRNGEPIYERPPNESISNSGWAASLMGYEPSEFTNEKQRVYMAKMLDFKKSENRSAQYDRLASDYVNAQKSGKQELPAATKSVVDMLQKDGAYGYAEQADIVNGVSERIKQLTSTAVSAPSKSQLETWMTVDELLPGGVRRQVRHPVNELLLKLKVAEQLGLTQYLSVLAPQIPQEVLQAAQGTGLLQMGLTPELLRRIQAGESQGSGGSERPSFDVAPLAEPSR